MTKYLLDNASALAPHRFDLLAHLYDARSLDLLRPLVSPGSVVWMPGAGSGSLVSPVVELMDRGRVWATDLDMRWFTGPSNPRVTALQHDLIDPPPMEVGSVDVIHARLVLQHIPAWRARVLPHLLTALAPGGYLVVEELDPITQYHPHPASDTDRLVNQVGDAFTSLLGAHGAEWSLGRQLVPTLQAVDMVVTHAEGYQAFGVGGDSDVKRLMAVNVLQTGKELEEVGVPHNLQTRYLDALADPAVWLAMPVMYSVIARKVTS